jgi:hypothetical protein
MTRRKVLTEVRRQFRSLPLKEYPTIVALADASQITPKTRCSNSASTCTCSAFRRSRSADWSFLDGSPAIWFFLGAPPVRARNARTLPQ